MLRLMPNLYGDRISEAESAALIARLRTRGTPDAIAAVAAIGTGPTRNATAANSLRTRDAILVELREWHGLGEDAPGLARLKRRLSSPQPRRII